MLCQFAVSKLCFPQATAAPQKFEEIIPNVFEDNYDDYAAEPAIMTATPRSFNVRRKGQGRRNGGGQQVLHLDAVSISSTPGSFRIIQPIQIVTTPSPSRSVYFCLIMNSPSSGRIKRARNFRSKSRVNGSSNRSQVSNPETLLPHPTNPSPLPLYLSPPKPPDPDLDSPSNSPLPLLTMGLWQS